MKDTSFVDARGRRYLSDAIICTMNRWGEWRSIALVSSDGSAISLAYALTRRFSAGVYHREVWDSRDNDMIDAAIKRGGYSIFVGDSPNPKEASPRGGALSVRIAHTADAVMKTRFVGNNIEVRVIICRRVKPGAVFMAHPETDSERFNRALKGIQDGATGDERMQLLGEMTEAASALDAKRES